MAENTQAQEREIKKTMEKALAFVTEFGRMSAENLEKFTADFCIKASGSGESKPREITKLFDAEGVLLGGRCSATLLWFPLATFNHHHGLSKQAQNVKSRRGTEAKVVEAEAAKLLDSARELTEPAEKLEAFEAYDVEMGKAKAIREQAVTVADFSEEVESFESVDALAGSLGVEVITSKPKAEKEETSEETPPAE